MLAGESGDYNKLVDGDPADLGNVELASNRDQRADRWIDLGHGQHRRLGE